MNTRRIIFLDIDGVLNGETFFVSRFGLKDTKFSVMNEEDYRVHQIDVNAVGVLNFIIKTVDADIVLTSSWRYHQDDTERNKELSDFLVSRGLIKAFIDVTPRLSSRIRGEEIAAWLEKNPCDEYVILDDDSDMLENQMSHFVHTSSFDGLTARDAYKAIDILNGKN